MISLHREDDIFHKALLLVAPPSVELITLALKSVLVSLNSCQL